MMKRAALCCPLACLALGAVTPLSATTPAAPGDAGGRIVAEGTPAQIARRRRHSHTGRVLGEFLRERTRAEPPPGE